MWAVQREHVRMQRPLLRKFIEQGPQALAQMKCHTHSIHAAKQNCRKRHPYKGVTSALNQCVCLPVSVQLVYGYERTP